MMSIKSWGGALNAARCSELGISRSLHSDDLAPSSVRDIVLQVLQTPSYRRKAERLRREFERLPGVQATVELLERLSREKQPILA